MFSINKISVLLLLSSVSIFSAQGSTSIPVITAEEEAPAVVEEAPAITEEIPAVEENVAVVDKKNKLDSLEIVLIDARKMYSNVNSPLYSEALARVKSCRKVEADEKILNLIYKPTAKFVEAAIVELELKYNLELLLKSKDNRISVLSEIHNIQNQITAIEKGFSSDLQKNLEQQKQLTEEQRLQAEAEKARREQLEAEALARQQDAESKLRNLQSELINVKKDARGIILSMSDILFAVGKADLTSDLKTSLAKIVGILTVYKESKILVEGHTDNTGSQELNNRLSLARAENVMNFMIKQGLQSERMTSKGYGMTQPVADNATKEGRQKNRRVDLIIADK